MQRITHEELACHKPFKVFAFFAAPATVCCLNIWTALVLGGIPSPRQYSLVYGGAKVGLMGRVADRCLAAGGQVVGVMPRHLSDLELAHPSLTQLHLVDSMHQRKAMMADLSDAFVALPGGIGTLEELFEVWTWTQLGLHQKPLGVLNVGGFYQGLLDFVTHVQQQGFMKPIHADLLLAADEPADLIARLSRCQIPQAPKWVGSLVR